MNQNSRVIKFPKRGRFARQRREATTRDRQAVGNAWLARIRQALEEVNHG